MRLPAAEKPGRDIVSAVTPGHGDAPDEAALGERVDSNRLIEELNALDPSISSQSGALERMKALATNGGVAADRGFRPGHFTGSALVVDPERRAFVLLFHRKLQRWLQPGGHADGELDIGSVARREASEETGIVGLQVIRPAIDLDIHEVRPPQEDPHLHFDMRYLVVAPAGAQVIGNHESTEIAWVTLGDLDRYGVDESVERLVTAGFAALDALDPDRS